MNPQTAAPGKVLFNKDRCKGCSYCVEFCPRKSLKMSQEISDKGYVLAAVDDPAKCTGCGLCEMVCPDFAVRVTGKVQNQN
jgi:2-oxoglutarate ferredoxin oxidoreductase subunit delta